MKIENVKEIIESQKNKLPLSYSELIYKKDSEEKAMMKIINSDYYNDNSYFIFPLFKKISRLL